MNKFICESMGLHCIIHSCFGLQLFPKSLLSLIQFLVLLMIISFSSYLPIIILLSQNHKFFRNQIKYFFNTLTYVFSSKYRSITIYTSCTLIIFISYLWLMALIYFLLALPRIETPVLSPFDLTIWTPNLCGQSRLPFYYYLLDDLEEWCIGFPCTYIKNR